METRVLCYARQHPLTRLDLASRGIRRAGKKTLKKEKKKRKKGKKEKEKRENEKKERGGRRRKGRERKEKGGEASSSRIQRDIKPDNAN